MSMDTCKLIQVIESTIARRGKGDCDDPIRVITQYFSPEGALLAEVDPHPPVLFAELAAAGDRLAHELQHIEHGFILDKWWQLRGGHHKCTYCNPQEASS